MLFMAINMSQDPFYSHIIVGWLAHTIPRTSTTLASGLVQPSKNQDLTMHFHQLLLLVIILNGVGFMKLLAKRKNTFFNMLKDIHKDFKENPEV